MRDDGSELILEFVGGPPLITEYPGAQVVETDQTVSVVPVARQLGPSPNTFTSGPTIWRSVRVRLSRPLADRVLVDLDGSVCVVEDSITSIPLTAE